MNFFNKAKHNGWIKKLDVIPGKIINNMFCFQKEHDRLETGQVYKDNRFIYYQITTLGKEVIKDYLNMRKDL
jgi:tRNA(His) 5'-end guanylyltransferase